MGVVTKVLIFSTMVCLNSAVHGLQAVVDSPPYVPSRCFGSKDQGVMVAKLHSSLFANGGACGRKYRIRCISGTNKAIHDACTGNTVDVMVIDQCKTCLANDLVLSQEAFAKIARPTLGKVNIDYHQI